MNPTTAQLDAVEVVIDLGLEPLVNAAADAGADVTLAISRAANELAADLGDVAKLSPESFIETVLMEQRGELSATQAKTVLGEVLAHGGSPRAIAAAMGFEQLSSSSLGDTVEALIAQYPDEWARYREGDEKLAQFFIGQVMKVTKGQANGKSVIDELQARR
jgi:aspartyl-tRNA(Asn)/glutamyl-tRNA(Gln) amidotransferase subunit B